MNTLLLIWIHATREFDETENQVVISNITIKFISIRLKLEVFQTNPLIDFFLPFEHQDNH